MIRLTGIGEVRMASIAFCLALGLIVSGCACWRSPEPDTVVYKEPAKKGWFRR